jgi:hypothetical protein
VWGTQHLTRRLAEQVALSRASFIKLAPRAGPCPVYQCNLTTYVAETDSIRSATKLVDVSVHLPEHHPDREANTKHERGHATAFPIHSRFHQFAKVRKATAKMAVTRRLGD